MAEDLTITCSCGAFQGLAHDVAARHGNHVVCYCHDCQAFARFLGRQTDVLDLHGGTDIFQMSPAKVSITAGAARLSCMRLTERGMLRWYTSCCNTPIGNTMATSTMPFVGLIRACLRPSDPLKTLEHDLGPVLMRAFRKLAYGDATQIPADRIPFIIGVARFGTLMLSWKLRGDASRSIFFDGATRRSVARPLILNSEQRAPLYPDGV